MAGGSAEFAASSLFPVFQAYGRGIPVRIVAPITIYDKAPYLTAAMQSISGEDPAPWRPACARSAASVGLAGVQKPLDFAYNCGVINRHYDARAMLTPFVPMEH